MWGNGTARGWIWALSSCQATCLHVGRSAKGPRSQVRVLSDRYQMTLNVNSFDSETGKEHKEQTAFSGGSGGLLKAVGKFKNRVCVGGFSAFE